MHRARVMVALTLCVLGSDLLVANRVDGSPQNLEAVVRPVRLMSAEKDARLRAQIPKVNDPDVQAILDDPALILYTEAEMPTAYQDWSSGLKGIHSPSYNVSANNREPYGNGNVEFPWGSPGGLHRARNIAKFRFLWLPRDENGKLRPIVWFRKSLTGATSMGYAWTYPVGAVVGEVLQLRSPKGNHYTFEIRLRKREQSEWLVDVYRPFPTAEQLADAIRERRPNWNEDEQLTKLISALVEPKELPRKSLSDSSHSRYVFNQTMGVDSLPAAGDDQLVAELLTETEFSSALGATWRTGTNDVHTVAPTTEVAFHVVPAGYDAGFIEVDRISCMRCHETVNRNVNEFDFGRDWYGRIRGSDGIFSIHPFDPSCISYSGFSQSARINGQLVHAGVFAAFNPSIHSKDVYRQLPNSRE